MFGFGSGMMQRLGPASYSKSALVKFAGGLATLFLMAAIVLAGQGPTLSDFEQAMHAPSQPETEPETDPEDDQPFDPMNPSVGAPLQENGAPFDAWWQAVAGADPVQPADVMDVLFAGATTRWQPDWSILPQDAAWLPVAKALQGTLETQTRAANLPTHGSIGPALQTLVAQSPRAPWVSYAFGHALATQGDFEQAGLAYEQAFKDDGHGVACDRAVLMWQWAGRTDHLKQLAQDPAYAKHINGHRRIRWAMQDGDWWQAAALVLPTWWQSLSQTDPWVGGLALVSGFCWLAFVYNFAGSGGSTKQGWKRLGWCLVALVLGGFSTQITLFLFGIQTHVFDLDYNALQDGWARGAVYCLLIGLREEFSKAVVLLPLVFLFGKRVDMGFWLLIAGCVGLGFAIEENLGYVTDGSGLSSRFITANFFHMTLTALIGYRLFWLVRNPKAHANGFFETAGICVAAHAGYDALLMIPELEGGSYFAMTVFVLLAYQYFHLLRSLRDPRRQVFSLTSVFVVGLVVTLGGSLVLLSARMGLFAGGVLLAMEALGIAIITLLYFQQVDETLQP